MMNFRDFFFALNCNENTAVPSFVSVSIDPTAAFLVSGGQHPSFPSLPALQRPLLAHCKPSCVLISSAIVRRLEPLAPPFLCNQRLLPAQPFSPQKQAAPSKLLSECWAGRSSYNLPSAIELPTESAIDTLHSVCASFSFPHNTVLFQFI